MNFYRVLAFQMRVYNIDKSQCSVLKCNLLIFQALNWKARTWYGLRLKNLCPFCLNSDDASKNEAVKEVSIIHSWHTNLQSWSGSVQSSTRTILIHAKKFMVRSHNRVGVGTKRYMLNEDGSSGWRHITTACLEGNRENERTNNFGKRATNTGHVSFWDN